jgi:chemotaxis protein MotB
MVTLLLAFFVMLAAFSKVDLLKFAMISKTMNEAMDKDKVVQISIDSLVSEVQNFITQEQLQKVVDVNVTGKGVEVSAKGAVLFPSGSADLLESSYKILDPISNIILKTHYNIAVEGHTDNVPISSELAEIYPTNWELSAARAAKVVRYFMEKGVLAKRLRAVGYADTVPVASNDTEEGRTQNRRVTVVFLLF